MGDTMTKTFNTKMKTTHIPYPAIHNIIRGTEPDKPSFLIRVYLYNLFMVQKKLFMGKALAVPLSVVNNNTAISHMTLYNKFRDNFEAEDMIFRPYDKKYNTLEYKNTGSKLLIASPQSIEQSLNMISFSLMNRSLKTKSRISDRQYIDHATKYFSGKLIISGNFQKILWDKKVTTKELRILLAVMRKVANQKKVPALNIEYFTKFTGMKPYLIRNILHSLKEKELIISNSINNLRKGHLVEIYVAKEIDSSQEEHIKSYLSTQTMELDDITNLEEPYITTKQILCDIEELI